MTTPNTLCSHLQENPVQASCVIRHMGSATYCAPCAADRLDELIRSGQGPVVTATKVDLTKCSHRFGAARQRRRCTLCYTSLIGYLMGTWGYSRAQGESGTDAATHRNHANRLLRLIRCLLDYYGSTACRTIYATETATLPASRLETR